MSTEPSKPRASVWEWVLTVVLSANLVWTTLCLGGYLAGTMVVTSLLTAALAAVYGVDAWFDRGRPHPAGLWMIPFVLYAAANVIWITPVRWLGWVDWFDWLQMVVVFWVVLNGIRSPRHQAVLWGVLLALGAVAVWLACYQRFVDPNWLMLGRKQASQYAGRSSGPFGIPNSLAALLLLLIPPVIALTIRRGASVVARVFFGWLLLVFLVGLGLSVSRGAWLGLALALIAWPLFGVRSGWRQRIARTAAVAMGIAVALALTYAMSSIVQERFAQLARDAGERSRPILWRAGWQMFRERPFVGTGAGSFNVLFEKYRPEGFLPQPVWAHNDYLNTLTDYGLIGFLLFFGTAVLIAVNAVRHGRLACETPRAAVHQSPGRRRNWLDDPRVRQAFGVGVLAFGLQLFVDFHFKIPALAMAFATVAGLVVSRAWPRSASQYGPLPVVLPLAAVLVALAIAVGITPLYRGEALRYVAREAMDRMAKSPPEDAVVRTRLVEITRQLDRAVQISPTNGQAWSDHAYALAQTARLNPETAISLGRQAEADANRAIALSPVVAEFWLRRGVARDLQNRWADAGPDFSQALVLSPNAVLAWYHFAYHMLLRPTGLDMGQAAVEVCLRLDPDNPEVQELRHRLATSHSGL